MNQILGDRHNFGRYTYKSVADGQSLIHKPRPVFWEWLFFGSSSPLKAALDQDPESNLVDIFQLKISDPFNLHSGQVDEVETCESLFDKSTFEKYASLTAYCTFWGISDLHINNLLKTGDLFLPIDVECVLMPMLLPNETGLLPHKNIPTDKCLYGKFASVIENEESSRNFIACFAKTYLFLMKKNDVFLKSLSDITGFLENCPIRVLLKPTAAYVSAMAGTVDIPLSDFLPEEIAQMKRDDIPYFFSTIKNLTISSYADTNFSTAPVSEPPLKIEKLISSLEQMLNLERQNRLFINSMLWLAKNISNRPFTVTDTPWSLERNAKQIELVFQGQRFVANSSF